MSTYREIAQQKFPFAVITSNGRFALASVSADGRVRAVYLLQSEEQANAAAKGVENPRVFDLRPTPCPDLPDDYEDRQRERRQKRLEKFPK